MNDRLDPDAARDVLRRAAELDADGRSADDGLERAALQAAAAEVGISPAAVRRALAEHDAGALAVAPGPPGLLGPTRTGAVRNVELPAPVGQASVERWLRGQTFAVTERRGEEVVWARRDDLAAKLRRKIDVRKRVRLDNVDRVIASVVSTGDGRCIIRIEADLDDTSRGLLTGVVVVPTAAGPILGGAAGVLTGEIALAVGGIPLGLALGGLGILGGRRTLQHEREDAERTIRLFLDELQLGC